MNPVAGASAPILDVSQLKGVQKEVITLEPRGHSVILGGPGTGKTVLSVLRAMYLRDPEAEHSGRTLLVTYNRSLLAYLNHFIPPGTKRLDARTYHEFAIDYLEKTGKLQKGSTVRSLHELSLIKEAREEVRQSVPDEDVLTQSVFFLKPELDWIVQNGFLTEERYIDADRSGRGHRLERGALEAIFQVQEAYWRLRSEAGKQYSWEDMPAAVHSALKQDESERRYKHVVIDEGQDFSPEMIRSLALAIPEDGSLTFFGDLAQQIYCHGISWRSAGLEVSKVWELAENHRSSPEIAKLASAIEDMPYFSDQPDIVRAEPHGEPGSQPTFVTFASLAAEDAFIIERAEALAADGSVAVLCRRYEDAMRLGKQLQEGERLNRYLGTWHPGPGIWYGTVHAAKGYEFESVILVGLTSSKWPERRAITQLGEEQAAAVDGCLLHVGVSRARQNLIMTAAGKPTSLLPSNDDLWQEEHRGPTPEEVAAAEAAKAEAAERRKRRREKAAADAAKSTEDSAEGPANADAESSTDGSDDSDAESSTDGSDDAIEESLEEWPDQNEEQPPSDAPEVIDDGSDDLRPEAAGDFEDRPPESSSDDEESNVVPLRQK
jgi:superfamily I DNA/RNA helicase